MNKYPDMALALKALRLASDLSTRDVANKMGCKTTYITDCERGEKRPSLMETLDRYAYALGVSAAEIIEVRDYAGGIGDSNKLDEYGKHKKYRAVLMHSCLLLERKESN